jgi:hypothetical protein
LYLDDDIASPVLARLLRAAGHDVLLPADVGLSGEKDPVHLTRAIREDRATLTRNYGDFETLHNLIMQARGHHPGVLLVRRDDQAKRNMTPAAIVRALRNLEASSLPIDDHCYELNPWQ